MHLTVRRGLYQKRTAHPASGMTALVSGGRGGTGEGVEGGTGGAYNSDLTVIRTVRTRQYQVSMQLLHSRMKNLLRDLPSLTRSTIKPPEETEEIATFLTDVMWPIVKQRVDLAVSIAERMPDAAWKEARMLLRLIDLFIVLLALDSENASMVLVTFASLKHLQV